MRGWTKARPGQAYFVTDRHRVVLREFLEEQFTDYGLYAPIPDVDAETAAEQIRPGPLVPRPAVPPAHRQARCRARLRASRHPGRQPRRAPHVVTGHVRKPTGGRGYGFNALSSATSADVSPGP